MADYYYGTISALAWSFGRYFYGGKHYVWLAKEFNTHGLPNPKSSNPFLIYQDMYQPWVDEDDYDRFIRQLRLDTRKGVIAKRREGVITPPTAIELKKITNKVDIVFFFPLVLRVDISQIMPASRLDTSKGSAAKGSKEVLIADLRDGEIDEIILFKHDVTKRAEFQTLVTDAITNGVFPPNPLAELQNCC